MSLWASKELKLVLSPVKSKQIQSIFHVPSNLAFETLEENF